MFLSGKMLVLMLLMIIRPVHISKASSCHHCLLFYHFLLLPANMCSFIGKTAFCNTGKCVCGRES